MKYLTLVISLCLMTSTAFAEIETVTVLGSTPNDISATYTKQAYQLGQQLAQRKKEVFYGGNGMGLGDALLKGILSQKGEVTGITTADLFKKQCPSQNECQSIKKVVVSNIHERKKLLFESGDIVVIMPGGFETVDEFSTFDTFVQLNPQEMKPVIFINMNHFWDSWRDQLFEMRKQGTVSKDIFDSLIFVDKVKDVLPAAEKAQRRIEQKENLLIKNK